MSVHRIVPNIAASDARAAEAFYKDALGLDVLMDLGWISTYGAGKGAQVTVATQGGSGTPVPDISIEVDDLDAVFDRLSRAGFAIEYGPVLEPWGVRRFYVLDPCGTLVNIVAHVAPADAQP